MPTKIKKKQSKKVVEAPKKKTREVEPYDPDDYLPRQDAYWGRVINQMEKGDYDFFEAQAKERGVTLRQLLRAKSFWPETEF